MSRLYIIPNASRIEESLALAERYGAGFEYNDFYDPAMLEDADRVNERIGFYTSLPRDRGGDLLHGAFYDIAVHSNDPQILAVSDGRVRQSMEIARRLGVRGVIFHTNLIANFKSKFYVDDWIEKNAAYWRGLAADYPDLSIYVENMFDCDPEPMVALMEALGDLSNFGACFDYAHASVFGRSAAEWADALLPVAAHLHVNDNDGLTDQHLALGEGKLDYALLDRKIAAYGVTPTLLIETADVGAQERSLRYLRQNGIYPFERRRTE